MRSPSPSVLKWNPQLVTRKETLEDNYIEVEEDTQLKTVLLVYEGEFGGHKGKVLLDSGANANFISAQFVTKHCLPVVNTNSYISYCETGKWQRMRCNKVVQALPVHIQAYRKDLTFVVTELDHYDILLGKLWLTTKNPEIDWRCNTATFHGKER